MIRKELDLGIRRFDHFQVRILTRILPQSVTLNVRCARPAGQVNMDTDSGAAALQAGVDRGAKPCRESVEIRSCRLRR